MRRSAAGLGLLLVTACGGDDGAPPMTSSGAATGSVTTAVNTGPGSSSTSTDASTSSTAVTSTTDASASETNSTTTSPTQGTVTTDACNPQTTGNAETGSMGFEFRDTSYCDYVQLDRVGFPLVTTLLVSSQDAYNTAPPTGAITPFIQEINDTLFDLHPALDDDVQAASLTPCDIGTCIGQYTPLLSPDTLRLDLSDADAFPNGRRLQEPTLDLVLGLLLLDLGVDTIDALAMIPLGPTQNDVTLPDAWPYVAGPQ